MTPSPPRRTVEPATPSIPVRADAREWVMDDLTRLYSRNGSSAHLQAPEQTASRDVLCNRLPGWPGAWLGSGSDAERSRAASLPICRHCLSVLDTIHRGGLPKGKPRTRKRSTRRVGQPPAAPLPEFSAPVPVPRPGAKSVMREPSLTITTIAGTRQPTDGPELVSASDASDESACFMLRRELHELPVVARFTVEGEPVSKARARFTKQGYKTQAYTPQKTLQAEQVIGWKFRAAARGHRLDPDAAYGVMGLFFCGTRQRRDVDNMLKLILDSLNGIAWPDDSQVTEVSAKKTLTLPENARTEVLVYRVGDVQRNIATCDKCGRDFATYPSWNNPKQRKRFCSQTCHLAWRDERKRTECAQCGKVFLRAKPNIPQKYCSRDCTDLAKRVELTCPHCEVRFTVTRHAGHRPRYCSPSCRDTAARERNKKNADQGFRQSESGSGMSGIAKAVLASDSRKHVLRVTYQLESGSCPRGRLRLIVTEVPGHHQRRSP